MAASAPATSASHPSEPSRAAPNDTSSCCWNGKTVSLSIGVFGLAAAAIALIIFATPVGAGIVGTALLATAVVLGVGGLVALIVYGFLRCKNQNQGDEIPATSGEMHTEHQIKVDPTQDPKYVQRCQQAPIALDEAITAILNTWAQITIDIDLFRPSAGVVLSEKLRTSLLENPSSTIASMPADNHSACLLAAFIKSLFVAGEVIEGTTKKFPLLYFLDPRHNPFVNSVWCTSMGLKCRNDSQYAVKEIAGRINPAYFTQLMKFVHLLKFILDQSFDKWTSRNHLARDVLNPLLHLNFETLNWRGGQAELESVQTNTVLAKFIIPNVEDIENARPDSAYTPPDPLRSEATTSSDTP